MLAETFLLFAVILTLHALINIYSSPLVALFNNISVFWHVAGVAVIVLVLAFVPDTHQSVDFVFTETINNSGFGGGMFWFYVLPLGFLLTMYTQTGYDASARTSPRRRTAPPRPRRRACGARSSGRASAAGSCCWRSRSPPPTSQGINDGAGSSLAVFATSLSRGLAEGRRA